MTPKAGITWNRQKDCLRPLWVNIQARVVDDIGIFTATQLFWNHTKDNIAQAAYTFPLPNGCSVTDFSCQFGKRNSNKLLVAKVRPRAEARANFDRAKTTAALGELNTSEIFTSSLGNIPAKARLRVEITFTCLLQRQLREDDDVTLVTLTIPTTIAPRYGTPPPEMRHANITEPLGITIEAIVISREPLLAIQARCKGHQITQEPYWEVNSGGQWMETGTLVRLGVTDSLGGDFVLNMSRPIEREQPSAWVEYHPEWPDQRAMMISIPPTSTTNVPGRSEILFLADRSGSMENKIGALKKAMMFFLRGIPEGKLFNIWCFGSKYTSMWRGSGEYNAQNLAAAEKYVANKFRSDMGGTELLPALRAVVDARDATTLTDVIVLTDGEYWALDDTTNFVRDTKQATNGGVRFFALGIGNEVSHALVENIARAGGGYSQVVEAAGGGDLTRSLVTMLDKALKDHASSVDIYFDGVEKSQGSDFLQSPTLLKSPFNTMEMSPFVHNRILLLLNTSEWRHSLPQWVQVVRNDSRGKQEMIDVRVQALLNPGTLIHKLAARALLGDLERRESWIQGHLFAPPRYSIEEEDLTRAEGEALGIHYNIASKWTSFFIEQSSNPGLDDPFLQDSTNPPSKHSKTQPKEGGSRSKHSKRQSEPRAGGDKGKYANSRSAEGPTELPNPARRRSDVPYPDPSGNPFFDQPHTAGPGLEETYSSPSSPEMLGSKRGAGSSKGEEPRRGAAFKSNGIPHFENRDINADEEDPFWGQTLSQYTEANVKYGQLSPTVSRTAPQSVEEQLHTGGGVDDNDAMPYEAPSTTDAIYGSRYQETSEHDSFGPSQEPMAPVVSDLAIDAPSSIPASNLAMVSIEKVTSSRKTRETDADEFVISSLIHLLTSEGCFKFADKKAGKKLLGKKFGAIVDALGDVDFPLASTIAVVVLLRQDYRKHRSFYRLGLAKAVQYIQHAFPDCGVEDENFTVDNFLLYLEAPGEECLYNASDLDDETEDERNDKNGEGLQRDLARRLIELAQCLTPGERVCRKTLASLDAKISEMEVVLFGVSSSRKNGRARRTNTVKAHGTKQSRNQTFQPSPKSNEESTADNSSHYYAQGGGSGEQVATYNLAEYRYATFPTGHEETPGIASSSQDFGVPVVVAGQQEAADGYEWGAAPPLAYPPAVTEERDYQGDSGDGPSQYEAPPYSQPEVQSPTTTLAPDTEKIWHDDPRQERERHDNATEYATPDTKSDTRHAKSKNVGSQSRGEPSNTAKRSKGRR